MFPIKVVKCIRDVCVRDVYASCSLSRLVEVQFSSRLYQSCHESLQITRKKKKNHGTSSVFTLSVPELSGGVERVVRHL